MAKGRRGRPKGSRNKRKKSLAELVRFYQQNPVAWIKDFLNAQPWSKQEEILNALAQNKRVTVRSCHSSGKTKAAAWAVLWFLHCFPDSVVVTTAPTWTQVENLLWREIRLEHAKATRPLGSKAHTLKVEISEKWYALGLSTDKPERFQGFHADHLLIVVDEASGVNEEIFQAIEGSMASEGAKLLLIGNPTQTVGTFYQSHQDDKYYRIHISCYDTPNFQGKGVVAPYLVTPDWVEDRKDKWGEESALFQIKCLGDFPSSSLESVIPLMWVREATKVVSFEPPDKVVMAVDVARYGDDRTVIYVLQNTNIIDEQVFVQKDTMYTAGAAHILARKYNPAVIAVDVVGVGAGVADRLREMGDQVLDVNSAAKASDSKFLNLRAEMWWSAREKFQQREISLTHEDKELFQELSAPLYTFHKGKIQIEGKEDVKKRLGKSPDKADAYIMGLYALEQCSATVAVINYERRAQDYIRAHAGRYSGF